MRSKWKIGFLLILAVEMPLLYWAGSVMGAPGEILAYLAGAVAAILLAILVLRPIFFGLIGLWLVGFVGSAWYFRGYVPAAVALTLGGILSTVACAVGWPFSVRILRFVLRGRF